MKKRGFTFLFLSIISLLYSFASPNIGLEKSIEDTSITVVKSIDANHTGFSHTIYFEESELKDKDFEIFASIGFVKIDEITIHKKIDFNTVEKEYYNQHKKLPLYDLFCALKLHIS